MVAIDLSPTLIDTARERLPAGLAGRVDFRAGDMREAGEGMFDIAVAMDSLIHYRPADAVRALGDIAARTRGQMVITFAPRTPMLSAMHAVGQLFPRGDRSPAIVPVGVRTLRRGIDAALGQDGWASARSHRVDRGFYISQALEVVRR